MKENELILAITGSCGAVIADAIMERSTSPVSIIATDWGKQIYEKESGSFDKFSQKACKVYSNSNLSASIASGSYKTKAMIIAPCSTNTMAKIASGICDNLVTRAAHCHLKEKRPLILCIRESPWTLMMIENAKTITLGGGVIAPISLPYYLQGNLDSLVSAYADRILSLTGQECKTPWEPDV